MKDAVLFAYMIYALLLFALFMFYFRHVSDGSGIMRLLICLAVPPVGCIWVLLLFSAGQSKIEISEKKKVETPFFSLPDGQRENQAIPMSEALVMNDNRVCCSMLLNILKDDPMKYVGSIKEALNAGDSETVHYAAAAIMQMRRMLMERVTQLASQCLLKNPDPALMEDYADALDACLSSDLFDEAVEMSMSKSFEEILTRLLAQQPTPQSFARMVKLNIREKNIKSAMNYSREFLRCYPEEEKAYYLYIECLIRQNDHKNLQDFLVALPQFPVELTQMTLQHIRCFIDAGFTA